MTSKSAIFDRLLTRQHALAQRRRKIEQKTAAIMSNCSLLCGLRSIRLVTLDLRDELCALRIMNFVTALRNEHPTGEIEANVSSFYEKVNTFPASHPQAKKLTQQIAQLKCHRPAPVCGSAPKKALRDRLFVILSACLTVYEAKLTYFPDSGSTEAEFLSAIDDVPASFHKGMGRRITRFIAEAVCGSLETERCGGEIDAGVYFSSFV
jgi:hypothetical protein